jgi:hypothetical protein
MRATASSILPVVCPRLPECWLYAYNTEKQEEEEEEKSCYNWSNSTFAFNSAKYHHEIRNERKE